MSALRVSSILPWSTVFLWAISIVPTFAQLLPELRILPLGDSITKGSGSSDGNGFRDRLRKKILAHGTATGNRELSVDMVGTLRSGAMMDNQHEGHSGKFLEDIATYWQRPIAYRPNIVLIHAGTNNMDKNQNVAAAPDLIAGIIDGILQEAPDAVVLVAPVIFAKSPAMQERTNAFNEKLNSIISSRRRTGKHLMSVPIDIKTEDLNDDKHPNNAGYEKMAQAWWNAILDAHELGWIKSPVEGQVPENSGSSCPDGVWESKRVIFDDYRLWDDLGTFQVAANPHKQEKIIFADLNGDGRADYIVAEDDGTVYAKLNTKRPDTWWHIGQINPGWNSVTGNMIRMADVDNDGKADMIVLYSDGVARVWKNTYDWGKFNADTDTTGQTFFTALDSRWAAGLGEPRSNVRIIDMDGDGYADYVIVQSDGVVKWARNSQNNGKDQSKKNCEDVQTIAPGVAGTPAGSTYLYDLDGNGKADYLTIYNGGAVKAYMNTGNLNQDPAQRNWDDFGTIAPGVDGVTGGIIRFADMDGDGRADFVAVLDNGSIRVFTNLGLVSSKFHSLRLADLTGDGRDDIIAVDHRGRARAWLNINGKEFKSVGVIAPGLKEDISTVLFADVNGDGLADFLAVYSDSSVKAYLNNGYFPDQTKARIWKEGVMISPGVGQPKLPGRKVRFADMNGDGYADYMILDDNGAVELWLNNKIIQSPLSSSNQRIWSDGISLAPGIGQSGRKIRFPDLDGDGRAEYLVQFDGGAAKGFYNTGNIPNDGQSRTWQPMGIVAGGVSNQGPVIYGDINGDKRDDYLVMYEDGSIGAYVSKCDWKRLPSDNEEEEEEEEEDDGGTPKPACSSSYDSIDDIYKARNNIPPHCMATYIAKTQHKTVENSLEDYVKIIKDDYERKFRIYAAQVRAMVPLQLREWMSKAESSGFWECTELKHHYCCKDCQGPWGACADPDCDRSDDCVEGDKPVNVDCPTDIPETPSTKSGWPKITYKLTDEEGFHKAISDEYGIQSSWVKLGDRLVYTHSGCGGGNPNPKECGEKYNIWWKNFPLPSSDIDVPDPKDLIGDSFDNTKKFASNLGNQIKLSDLGINGEASRGDIVDAASIPVLLVQAAVKSMDKVVEVAEDIEAAMRQQMIFDFLMVFLMLIPGVGALPGAGLMASIRGLIRGLGALADVAMSLYEVIENPDDALGVLFGLLIGGAGSGRSRDFSRAADYRRKLSRKEIEGLQPIREDLEKIRSCRTGCNK